MKLQAIFILGLCCWIGFSTYAQDLWVDGEVRFSQDSVFTGHFKFSKHIDKEIIALKDGNRLLALPPKEILSAEGIVQGEVKRWKTKEFKGEDSGFNVHLFLEEVYAGQRYRLYRKDLSFIKWSPYADIVCDAVSFDSYKHLVNPNALLLKDRETDKMVVINRPNSWNSNKYMVNKNVLCDYLNTDKKNLKTILKENDLKLQDLTDIVTFFMILEDSRTHQLSYSGD